MKPIVQIEIQKGERVYTFQMPVGAPVGEALDAAFDVLDELRDLIHNAVSKSKPQESQEA